MSRRPRGATSLAHLAVCGFALGGAAVAGTACSADPTPTHAPTAALSATAPSPSASAAQVAPVADADHELLVPIEQCEAATSESVKRADVIAELAVVERILRDGYSGFEAAAQRGVDWDAVFSTARKDAALLPDAIDAERYGRWLGQALSKAGDDSLQTVVKTRKDGKPYHVIASSRTAWIETRVSEALFKRDRGTFQLEGAGPGAAPKLHSCEGLDLERAMVRTIVGKPLRVRYRLSVTQHQAPASVTCTVDGGRGLERAVIELRSLKHAPTGAPKPPLGSDAGPVTTIALARLGTLVRGGKEAREAFEKLGPAGKPVLLDLRATDTHQIVNRESYWPLDGSWLARLSPRGPSIDKRRSSVIAQGTVNHLRCLIGRMVEKEAKFMFAQRAEAALEALELERRERQAGAAKPREVEPLKWTTASGKPPVIVALVDSMCGGVCEDALTILKGGSGAVVVGHRTAGTGRERVDLPYRLPKSGLWLNVPSATFSRPDAAPEDGGYQPDFVLDVDDPLPLMKELAQCLGKPACKRQLLGPGP